MGIDPHRVRIYEVRRDEIDAEGLADALLALLPFLDDKTRAEMAVIGAEKRRELEAAEAESTEPAA